MTARPRALVAFGSGLLFAAGLAVSGMTKPAKVEAFLDVTGAWDPSLALVMVGAISVYALAVVFAKRRGRPFFAAELSWPTATAIDLRLVGGAALFGVGWGLSGYCPGPALVSVAALDFHTVVFVGALGATLVLVRRLRARAAARASG